MNENNKNNEIIERIEEKIRNERGGFADIHKVISKFPQGLLGHYEFYNRILLGNEPMNNNDPLFDLEFPELPLNRTQREYLARETSIANQCEYCIGHHSVALQIHHTIIPNDQAIVLSELANVLTKEPSRAHLLKEQFLEVEGFTLAHYQHAVMIVSYFNLANRIAFAFNLELENSFEETCN